jgi:hypothetical protein
MRNLRFDFADPGLHIDTNALLCPNPNEFYSRAYLTADVADTYRALPGIKSRTKLANVTFGSILKSSTCNFEAPTDTLNAIDIDVCAFSAMAQICQFELEQSFVALQMTQGSNGDFTVPSFMNYYWGEMAKQIEEDIELIRWQGDTNSLNELLKLCDGYLVKLCGDSANLAYTGGGAVDSTNVIATFTSVYNGLPASVKSKKADLRFRVSSNVAVAYELAAATGNTLTYVTLPLGLTFLGIKVVVCEGMPNNTIVASLKDDLIYAFDAEGDSKALKAVNLTDSVAEPYLRTRANVKAGFYYTNPEQIAVWASCFD